MSNFATAEEHPPKAVLHIKSIHKFPMRNYKMNRVFILFTVGARKLRKITDAKILLIFLL